MSDCELINLTPENSRQLERGLLLPVMEMFYSIQGEGFNTGRPAAFVRIGGCDVGCHWCDVKESWNAALHPLTIVSDIVDYVYAFPANAVVITGGEPLRYNLNSLCGSLKEKGVSIYLETCGGYPLSGQYDWICLSPKRNMEPRPDMLHMADELKVIVYDKDDLEWAERNAERVKQNCRLYLQPEWSRYTEILPVIVDYIKAHPQWMVSIQAHKFMRIP
ncbi:MAG: 7-carboxy-7-deazaguanine synthase QueE [Bacteroidales bacterium]